VSSVGSFFYVNDAWSHEPEGPLCQQQTIHPAIFYKYLKAPA